MPQTKQLRSNRCFFLTVLEAGRPSAGCQYGRVRAASEMQTGGFSLGPHEAEGVRELCGASFVRALIPFMRAPSSDLITPKGLTSYHHHTGNEVSNI